MSGNWHNKILSYWKGWIIPAMVAVLIATSFKSAIADWNDVPTGSMIPTIYIGDRVFINKLAYDLKFPYTTLHLIKWADPQRGDIVVFYSPADGKRLIKRVVGIPGDTVAMHNNRLYINDTALPLEPVDPSNYLGLNQENALPRIFFQQDLLGGRHSVMLTPSMPSPHSFRPIKITEGNYFMMGDNRDNSADSRYFGPVDRKNIVGKATAVVLSRESLLHPRWDRFFKKLL